jgi:hypothetical protein
MENTLNGKISPISAYISFNNNTNFKIFRFFLSTRYRMDKAKKPSHAILSL